MNWEQVGSVAPRDLRESRTQAHWASQLVAAVGASLAPPRPDDSHTALTCITDRSWLVSAPAPRRVALSIPELSILALDDDSKPTSALALEGKTLQQGLDWIASELDATSLAFPDYEMPPHPIQDGAPFHRKRPEDFAELSRWFANAAHVLRALDLGEDRSWPHHFDIAVLETLEGDKSIGVGLSPGDGSYDEPYWYVTPWPYPDAADLPGLPDGHWHREGFTAAILTGSDIAADAGAAEQLAIVNAFLESAIASSRQLLA